MKIITLLLLTLLFAGCNSASTPQEAIDSMVKAIRENDLSDLKDYLAFEAKEKYGNKDGLKQLRAALPMGARGQTGNRVQRVPGQRATVEHYQGFLLDGFTVVANLMILCNEFNEEPAPVTYCWVEKIALPTVR